MDLPVIQQTGAGSGAGMGVLPGEVGASFWAGRQYERARVGVMPDDRGEIGQGLLGVSPSLLMASGKARKGNAALGSALCEAAWAAAHTKDGYLPAQYRRFLRRFGKKNEGKAIFALAHSLLVIILHVLSNGCDYEDLGGDYFERHNDADARQRYLVRELQKLGHIVTLEPAA